MSFDTDAITDRRRLKRRLFFWRLTAFVAFLIIIGIAASRFVDTGSKPHVARLDVSSVIVENDRRQQALANIAKDDQARALVVYINSPGGTTYAGEQLYKSLRRVAAKKPVITVIGTVGASGGYMTALAGDRIFAGESSITGSIGVIVQLTEFSKLMEKVGISASSITSGRLKGEPSPFKPLSEEGRRNLQDMVTQSHNWFVNLVAERRPLSPAEAAAYANGGVYIGKSALQKGLIDELGGLVEARAWLESEKKIPASLPMVMVDYSAPKGPLERLLQGMLGKSVISERLTLDGLISLWHPK